MVFTNVYNPRSAIPRKKEFKNTIVKKGATIGANATILCGVTVGEHSFVAAGAVVITDVDPFALMVGVPARKVGWMSRYGKQIPLSEEGTYRCPHTSEKYILENNKMRLEV